MMRRISAAVLPVAVLAGMVGTVEACTACFGRSDSEMAHGMNWGIYTLLAVLGLMLGCVSAFFVMIGRRSARVNVDPGSNASQPRS